MLFSFNGAMYHDPLVRVSQVKTHKTGAESDQYGNRVKTYSQKITATFLNTKQTHETIKLTNSYDTSYALNEPVRPGQQLFLTHDGHGQWSIKMLGMICFGCHWRSLFRCYAYFNWSPWSANVTYIVHECGLFIFSSGSIRKYHIAMFSSYLFLFYFNNDLNPRIINGLSFTANLGHHYDRTCNKSCDLESECLDFTICIIKVFIMSTWNLLLKIQRRFSWQ
ncbi:Uncharacterised protein [Weissella viridescens]|uniref:Uncharacterized protein n=1 Tax=Weissella viridescens TaxID=1629 RepID=A0A380P116_WEIVI|nr:Uncharacterised protein [Weissella viridescens]